MKKIAYVAGHKLYGYTIHFREQPTDGAFAQLTWPSFPTYRAAQDIANTINAYYAKRGVVQES